MSEKPPEFDAAEWEELGLCCTDDSYVAVAPGGSAENMPAAKKPKL